MHVPERLISFFILAAKERERYKEQSGTWQRQKRFGNQKTRPLPAAEFPMTCIMYDEGGERARERERSWRLEKTG